MSDISTIGFDYKTYNELSKLVCERWGGTWPEIASYMTSAGMNPDSLEDLAYLSNSKITYAKNGSILSITTPSNVTHTATSAINSNSSTISRGVISGPISTGVNNSGKVTANVLRGAGTKVATAATKIAVPLTLASLGVTLGKTIDEALYNANPDYWNSIGLSTLNPQTWSNIAGGDGTPGGDFLNLIFGIDPSTGEAQPYLDADALAYMSYCMAQAGFFDSGSGWNPSTTSGMYYPAIPTPIPAISGTLFKYADSVSDPTHGQSISVESQIDDVYSLVVAFSDNKYRALAFSKSAFSGHTSVNVSWRTYSASSDTDKNNNVFYKQTGSVSTTYFNPTVPVYYVGEPIANFDVNKLYADIAYTVLYGTAQSSLPGVGDQSGATIPNFSGLEENQVLPYLQNLYPDMFSNSITYPVVQPDGTVNNHTYVPITLADSPTLNSLQPISGNQTQSQTSINSGTSPDVMVDLLTKLLQQTMTDPIGGYQNPPNDPTDTGDGSSPTPTPVTGSASSLWKVYHPTQSQIDSFGSWLWSSDFVDQILKIFNDPMQAIIGLHKVYVTPTDAGTATIKVGYLDSQVPSAYVENQYEYVNCGSVDLLEQFGNVFDYDPYTTVQLYLPFIGIVPLNVSEVMRSTISVEYGVDVFTGACLAMVEVSRDGYESILYQYAGNCSVQYPISSGSYMGIVSSIISIAGGVAATVATGGGAAPIVLGTAGAAMNAHTNVQHSGSFSGNSGAMGGKTPYLIINRPQTKMADNFESMQGYPTNVYTTVGECSGYIKCSSVHVINVSATDEELNMINDILYSGILI